MTQYKQTVAKNTGGIQASRQTGLLPAAASLPSILGGAGTALGLGSLASKASKALKIGGSGAKKAGKGLGGGTGVGLAKAGLGTYALSEFNKFMNSGPSIGGVNIVPVATIGVAALFGGKMFLGDGFNPMMLLPVAGAGIMVAATQL